MSLNFGGISIIASGSLRGDRLMLRRGKVWNWGTWACCRMNT